jgi:hypothetical protein
MPTQHLHSRTQVDRFVWQYAFYVRLICRDADLPEAQLWELAEMLEPLKGHLDPNAVAEELLQSWPFDPAGQIRCAASGCS